MREWLLSIDPRFVALMQIASSTMLALAGFCVSLTTAVFGYRSNFGWHPAILVTEQVISERPDLTDAIEVRISFETWNRRKYPIRLDWVYLSFEREKVEYEDLMGDWAWMGEKKFARQEHTTVEANGRQEDSFCAIFRATTGEEFHDNYKLEVEFYDAKSNKKLSTAYSGRLDMRALHRPVGIGDTGH